MLDFYGNQGDDQIPEGNVVKLDGDEDEVDPYNPKDIRNFNKSPFGRPSIKVHPTKHDMADLPVDVDPFSSNKLVKAKQKKGAPIDADW